MAPALAADVGYRDFYFGNTVNSTPTGEKPECKLWYNDGSWWGSLWTESDLKYHLYEFNAGTQSWSDTGTALDDRKSSKADALWDEAEHKLYLVSSIFTVNPVPQTGVTNPNRGRLYRYSYTTDGSRTYSLDAGFPVNITSANAEDLTVAKDSTGKLWATWVQKLASTDATARVMVNCSLSSDSDWGTPFVLPTSDAATATVQGSDGTSTGDTDISAIIAFGGRVGVMWTNQLTHTFYFSVHLDGDADSNWQAEELVVPDPTCSSLCADDHLSLKADADGRVYAAIKTSLLALDSPLVLVAVREPAGSWSSYEFGRERDGHTRPILLLDEENAQLYVFATTPENGGAIYYKKTPLSHISFELGLGTPFIDTDLDTRVNNATSTKQNLNSTTGLLVLASDQVTRYYLHNSLALTPPLAPPPIVTSFAASMGPVGAPVTILGADLTGATAVTFNAVPAAFTVVSNVQIDTSLPAGATTGRIQVTTPGGTATASSDFLVTSPSGPSTPVMAGYHDFNFGTNGLSTPTGEKPESKLWWNDGIWWGSLWSDSDLRYHIFRFDWATQGWTDTGTALDDRHNSKADVLWDQVAGKLYVASHVFSINAVPLSSFSQWGRLYRYSYDAASKSYSHDVGFPVAITRGNAETMTLAKDSIGQLWVTWVEGAQGAGTKQVMLNHSVSSDLDWAEPSVLTLNAEAVTVSTDDISTLIAFDGDKLGLMWSNQLTFKYYFSVHHDGDLESAWQTEEVVLPDANCSGLCADDHLCVNTDSTGRVYAAVKTSLTDVADPDPAAAVILLVERNPASGWKSYVAGKFVDKLTRAILLLDEENFRVYVFATTPEEGGTIYYKIAPLGNISFPTGKGTPFIESAADTTINNATSTKQNLTSETGLLVLASDQDTRSYLHNALDLPHFVATPPSIASFSPASGPMGTVVTVLGSGFTGATAVEFNGTPATFALDYDVRITATVPAGATSGKIRVTTPLGTAESSASFILPPPAIASFSPTSGPIGTPVAILGTGFTGATAVTFNSKPAAFTVASATRIDAVVPSGATSGKIGVTTPNGTGASSANFSVTASPKPKITSFSPSSGSVGTPVTVLGSGLLGASALTFNGTPATFTVVSDTRIDATVPFGATTGRIKVTTPGGNAQSGSDFVVILPTITSFSPTSGAAGTAVAILGTNFTGATSVKFNATAATFTVVSATRIDATVPTGATSGKISVTTPLGIATSGSNFSVILPPAPTITSFSPTSGAAGAAVTVLGTNFTGATAVTFNGTAAAFTVVSATRIDTAVPAGATSGRIRVTTAGGTATSGSNFNVILPPAPTISSFSPTSGPIGAAVTILGTNFTGATSVKFNGTAATFTVVSATRIDTAVPSGATSGKISVTTPLGTGTSAGNFTISAPKITSFSPTSGPVGTVVTILGSNFTGATLVVFNKTTAPIFTVVSATRIDATVPAGATSGKIKVTTPGGTAQSGSNFSVTP